MVKNPLKFILKRCCMKGGGEMDKKMPKENNITT